MSVMQAQQPLEDSVKRAGVARFRPVMLTSLTTFFGLLLLLSEKATAAQILIPMAIRKLSEVSDALTAQE
jgi:multidrug efflux pump subunit AcrB